MRCRVGDLAIVVKSVAGNEGALVKCLEFLGYQLWRDPSGSISRAATWRVDRDLPDWNGWLGDKFRDDHLRPIRDPGDDAQDETLLWAGLQNREEVEQ